MGIKVAQESNQEYSQKGFELESQVLPHLEFKKMNKLNKSITDKLDLQQRKRRLLLCQSGFN